MPVTREKMYDKLFCAIHRANTFLVHNRIDEEENDIEYFKQMALAEREIINLLIDLDNCLCSIEACEGTISNWLEHYAYTKIPKRALRRIEQEISENSIEIKSLDERLAKLSETYI